MDRQLIMHNCTPVYGTPRRNTIKSFNPNSNFHADKSNHNNVVGTSKCEIIQIEENLNFPM